MERMTKRSRFADERIAYALRQAIRGTAVADVCRQLEISEATSYVWKRKYAGLGTTELRELRLLHEHNSKLKRLLADLTLDKRILGEIVRTKSEADTQAEVRAMDARRLRGEPLMSMPAGTYPPLHERLSRLPPEPEGPATAIVRGGPGSTEVRSSKDSRPAGAGGVAC